MSGHDNVKIDEASLRRGHEQQDLGIRMLFLSLLGLMLFTAIFAVLMIWMWSGLDARQEPRREVSSPLVETDVTPPEPRLETRSGEVLENMNAMRAMQSTTYAWLDRDNGIARIPVSRAMEIIAARGLDSGQGAATPTEEAR